MKKTFLFTALLLFALKAAPLKAALPAAQKEYTVRPVAKALWQRPLPTDSVSLLARGLIENCCRYTLGPWRHEVKHFDRTAPDGYLDLGGRVEKYIRPVSHEAFVLAFALKSGLCTPRSVGVSRKEAFRFAEQLIASMAFRHVSNSGKAGWGDQWQSALWAAQGAEAAWFLWDRLSPTTKKLVLSMLVHEADRFTDYEVPYYRSADGKILHPGDTKAEENAWNSNILTIACDMLPRHPHFEAWRKKSLELQLSAYAAPSDLQSDTVVDGVRLRSLLRGSNMNEDGTVVNHQRLHPDYMVAFMHNGTNAWLDRMAGMQPLESSTFNGVRVYRALTLLPFGKEKRTIYQPTADGRASSLMYFPEGNDWGTGRQANYWLMDVMAHVFGWDKGQHPKAYDWALARAHTMTDKMKESRSGRYFASKSENSFDTAEEFFAAQLVWGYLGLWLGR